MWVDAAWHPIVTFTSQILSERGDAVHILYRQPEGRFAIPGSTDFGTNAVLWPMASRHARWRNQIGYFRFLMQAIVLARKVRPDVVIGYDMHGVVAAYLASRAHPRTRLVYHNLDLAPKETLSTYARVVKTFEGVAARSADLVIFSSPGRAAIYKNEVRLVREPLVVMNCQRLAAPEIARGALRQLLGSRGFHFDRLVLRLGSLGPNHGVEATIRSMQKWNGNWGLLLVGMPIPSYLHSLEELVSSLDLTRNVIILPAVPYDLWYDCLYSSDLGIALYEPGNINHAHMAGAGNKLSLYLKAGIPSIVPDFPDFVAFMETYGAGKVANPTEPYSIAAAVNAVFSDKAEYTALCRRAATAFRTEFNFERQFDPVLRWLGQT
jgi:glycosyltransferase involved in cell wall biosynthesis